jgi:hypothetical protein
MSSKVMLDAPAIPDLKRRLLAFPCAAALLAGGCSPRAFDELRGPTTADAQAIAGEAGATEASEAGPGAADAADTELDAEAMPAEDAAAPDAAADAPLEPDAEPSGCPAPPGAGHTFKVKARGEVRKLPIPDAGVPRTVASATRLGQQIYWTFHNARFQAEPPVSYATAGFSTLERPLTLSDLAANDGVPLPLLEPTPGDDPSAFALNPGSVVATSEHAALIFFVRIFYLLGVSVGVAHVDEQGATTREPGFLFERAEPTDPLFYLGGFVDDGYLYLYSSELREGDPNSPLSAVVRAPVLDAARRASYRTWSADEQAWVTDLSKRSAVLSRVPQVLSVSYNEYLGGYLAVYSALSGDAVELHLAPAPQGPFRALGRVETEASPFPDVPTFYAQQQVALDEGCDQTIVVSYTFPTEREATVLGPIASGSETRLLEIELE